MMNNKLLNLLLIGLLSYGTNVAVFISAGNGALAAIRRIARGYPLREIQERVIARGQITDAHLQACETLGMNIAAGLELGIY